LIVGSLVEIDFPGCQVGRGLIPFAPRVEYGALDGENAVESGKKEWRSVVADGSGNWIFKELKQFDWDAGWADETARAAVFVEYSEPPAERFCIILPTDAGGRTQKPRRMVAKQFVGFHGQAREAKARAFEQAREGTISGGYGRPQGLLLGRVQ
jgi:hypothetical protein